MPKPLHFQVCEKRFQHYGFFLLLLISLFPVLSTNAKTHGYAPAITLDKEDYSPGQVALVPGAGWAQDQLVYAGFTEEPHSPNYSIRVFSEECGDSPGNFRHSAKG